MSHMTPFLRRLAPEVVATAIALAPALAGLFVAEAMDVGVDALAVLGPAGPAKIAAGWAKCACHNAWTATRLERLHARGIDLTGFILAATADGLRYAASQNYSVPTVVISAIIATRYKARGHSNMARLTENHLIPRAPAVYSHDGWPSDM